MGSTKSKPIAAELHAVPGWRALFVATGDDGNPVDIPDQPGKIRIDVVPVSRWGLVVPDPPVSLGARLVDAFGGLGFSAQRMLETCPIGPDDERLDGRLGFMGYAYPSENDADAIARIESELERK